MKKNRLFLYILLTIVSPISIYGSSFAENCGAYIRLVDASGFDSDSYQEDLETATCDFIQQYPELQDSFKVFDYGFYQHQENFQGSFPDAFQQKMDEVANLSPYYLLFGKQTDKTGIYTKFWVDLKLPDTGQFLCLDLVASDFRDNLEQRINNHVNNVYEISGKIPENYAAAEIATLAEVKRQLDLLSECCDPGSNAKSGEVCYNCPSTGYDILEQMIDSGLVLEEINIIEDRSPNSGSSTASGNTSLRKNLTTLDMTVSFSGDFESEDLDQFFDDKIIIHHSQYYQSRLGITPSIGKHYFKYPGDCKFKEKYEAYLADDSDLKIFVGIINIDGNIGIMAYKVGGSANYRDTVDGGIVISAIYRELDDIKLSSGTSLTTLTNQHLHVSSSADFIGIISIDDDWELANYQIVIDKYRERKNAYVRDFLDRIQQFWRDEFNYYALAESSQLTKGTSILNGIMVSWNLISGAIHTNYTIPSYERTFDEMVTELLLEFHCAQESGSNSFSYLQTGTWDWIDLGANNSPFPDILDDDGIVIVDIDFPQTPDDVYDVSITGVQSRSYRGVYGEVILQGLEENNFTCIIRTKTRAQADLLRDKFNLGLGAEFIPDYTIFLGKLEAASQNCDREKAKNIIASIPSCAIENLNNLARIRLVNCLTEEGKVDRTEEVFIVKLLRDVQDPCGFIGLATSTNSTKQLKAENLIEAIDNKTTGQGLIKSLYDIFHECNQAKNKPDTLNAVGLISIHPANEGQYKFDAEAVFQSKVEFTTVVSKKFDNIFNEDNPELTEFGPFKLFDPVMMVDDIDIQGLNLDFGLEGMGVPAVTVPIILHYYDKKQLREALGLGAEIAFLTLGGGELVLAYRAYAALKNYEAMKRLGVAVLDVGAASIELYCSGNPNTVLCEKWKGISPFIAAGLITQSSYDLLKSRPNDLEAERIEDVIEIGARMGLKQKYPNLSNFRNWMDQAGDFPEDVLERLGEIDDVTFFQKLDADLAGLAFFGYLRDNPKGFRAWEKIYTGGFPASLRTRVHELFDAAGNPRIVLKEGTPPSGEMELTLNWNGQEITETFKIIDDAAEGGLRFRFKHFKEKNAWYGEGTSYPGQITHNIIPANHLDDPRQSLNISEIKLMQNSISNHTGEPLEQYFVLKNAMELKTGDLLVTDFPPIKVWVNLDDEAAGIWTLDHRRLIAAKAAGISEVPIEWAPQAEIIGDYSKMGTESLGENSKIWVYRKHSDGKFCHRNDPNIPTADKFKDEWFFESTGNGIYNIYDGDGNLIDLVEDIPNYLD